MMYDSSYLWGGFPVTLESGILGFLAMKPMSGYDIRRLFAMSASYFWPADQTQIYRTLKMLAREGLIELVAQEKGATVDRKIYAITEKGRSWNSARIQMSSVEDFISRDAFLVQLFFAGALEARELEAFLDAQLRNIREMERELRENYDRNFDRFLEMTGLEQENMRVRSAVWTHQWGLIKCREYAKMLKKMKKDIIKDRAEG